jgi:hypothetical protein
MQWDRSKTPASRPETPITPQIPNYLQGINVEDEMKDPWSIINFFQYAIALRKDPLINEQCPQWPPHDHGSEPPGCLQLSPRRGKKLMVISNMRPYQVYFTFYYEIADVLLHNYDGVIIVNHVFTLRPYESYLIKAKMNKYYLFISSGKIERSSLKTALDGLDALYEIIYLSDTSGYVLADEKFAVKLQGILLPIHDDLGVTITFLAVHKDRRLEQKLVKEALAYFPNQCLFLSDV